MAQQSSFYFTDGTTRTYPSSKHIASKQHVAVYFKSVITSTWAVIEASLYDLVNNSIVFTDSPDDVLYSEIEIRVADTAAELTDSPSDIATVASNIANVNTVAGSIADVHTVATNIASVTTVSGSITNVNNVGGSIANVNTVAGSITDVDTVAANILDVVSVADTIVPNIAEILLADNNATIATTQAGIATTQAGLASTSATNAQLSAWEAEAEKMTADSYATEAEDVFVKIYTSNGDGTFTPANTTEYSAFHWQQKAFTIVTAGIINDVTPALDKVYSSQKTQALHDAQAGLKSPAFTGTPTAPTAGITVANTQLATTEFVKTHGNEGRFNSGLNGSVVLTTNHINGFLYADVGTNIFRLPDAAACPIGSTITIYGLSAGFTITSTIANIYANQTTGVSSISVYKGASISLASNSSAWVQTSSSRNLGEGQNWVDVTGSRAKDTTYTNTTGMPINVSISIGFNASSTQVYFQVNGIRMAEMLSDASKQHSITFIVPHGQTYAVLSVSGTSVITRWAELR